MQNDRISKKEESTPEMKKIEDIKGMTDRIKKRRKSLNYTQEKFCETINLSVSSYTKIENAFQRPSLNTLINISRHLDLSLDYIVFGSGEGKREVSSADKFGALLKSADSEKLLYACEFLSRIANIE